MIFGKIIELFLENLIVQDKSPKTIDHYKYYLEKLKNHLQEQYNRSVYIDEIKPDHIEKFMFNIVSEDKYSSSARHNVITSIKSLYSFCERKGYVEINIGKLIKNIKVETPERAYISEHEFKRMIKVINTSYTAYAVVNTLFYAGLRINECISLTIEDIDLMNNCIKVKNGKGNKERTIPINDKLKKVLEKYLQYGRFEVGTNRFFSSKSGKICTQLVNRMIRNAVKKAGIEKKVSCHVLRHSFASNLIERGANILNVQKLLGHDSIKTTTIYLHTSFDELQEAINVL